MVHHDAVGFLNPAVQFGFAFRPQRSDFGQVTQNAFLHGEIVGDEIGNADQRRFFAR
jgi:hypothetical protein